MVTRHVASVVAFGGADASSEVAARAAHGCDGMSLAASVQHLEVTLPDDDSAPSAFGASTAAVQPSSVETVTVLRSHPSGLEVAGQFDVDGGHAKLIPPGRSLYPIAALGDADF